jgi:membrane fusion protein (multidrug efflux system)
VITRLVGRDGEMWIDFTLPQQHADVAVGITVRLSVSGSTFPAVVIARDAFINERSRNVSVRALADNESGVLYPGMLVSVSVPLGEPQRAALVPATAIRRDAFGPHVFVLKPAEEGARAPDRAVRRAVVLGPQRGDRVVVVEGLRVGERIAAAGSFKLHDGALSNAQEAAAEAGRRLSELARD